jgi:hypothetical protein
MEEECTHAMVAQVTIDSVDDTTVSFWTRSDSKTGDPNERLRRLFTVARSELWTAPIPGRPAPVELKPGATGPLYLSRAGWATKTPDGFQIFGASNAQFKEPMCLGAAQHRRERRCLLRIAIHDIADARDLQDPAATQDLTGTLIGFHRQLG